MSFVAMARTMVALDSFVPKTMEDFLDLEEKEDVIIAAERYSTNDRAKKCRKSAVLLIEEIWKSDVSYADALIPYIAMNYYGRLASRSIILNVLEPDVRNENLFVIGCLVISFNKRLKIFNFPLFLTKPEVRDYSRDLVETMVEKTIRSDVNFSTLTPIAFSDYLILDILKDLWPNIPRIRCLARQLIVKSKADIEMTAFKPTLVAFSATAAICSKLFPGRSGPLTVLFESLLEVDKVFEECFPKIIKWTGGLACNPVENEETTDNEELEDDVDVGWTDLGWTEVVGEREVGGF